MMKRANTIKKMSCPGCILTVLYGPDGRRALERDRPRSQQATKCSSAGQNRQSAVLFTFLRPGTVAVPMRQCQGVHSRPASRARARNPRCTKMRLFACLHPNQRREGRGEAFPEGLPCRNSPSTKPWRRARCAGCKKDGRHGQTAQSKSVK